MSLCQLWKREKSLRHVTMVIQEFCCHGNMTSHFSLLDWSKVDLSSLKWKAWIASQRARGVAWEKSRHFATPSWLSKRNDVWEKRRYAKPMPCYYPDLESASDWSGCVENLPQPRTTNSSSDASSVWNLCARFSDVISVASRNVGCFLRLGWRGADFLCLLCFACSSLWKIE